MRDIDKSSSAIGPCRLRYSDKWMRDGLDVCHNPAYSMTLEADMTDVRQGIETAKSRGVRLTYSHFMVRAAALALARNPDLHQMVCGNSRYHPAQVDIALSVAGVTVAAPLMVIENADRKPVPDIAREVMEREPVVREADQTLMKTLDRWGFLVPLSILRRMLLRALFRNVRFRRKGSGTFQVSALPGVDQASSPVFSTSAMLVVGGVREKPVVYRGNLAVRPMVTLTCCADHRVWDGRAGQRFLTSVRDILEGADLLAEIQ